MKNKKFKDLMSAFEHANSLFNQKKYQEFLDFVNNSDFSMELIGLLGNQYKEAIVENKNNSEENLTNELKSENIIFENGIELTVYSGGKPEDYVFPRSDKKVEKLMYYGDYIEGIDRRYYDYNEDDSFILRRVKVKLKNKKEFVGMLSDKAISKLSETKILPLIDDVGNSDFFKYTLINLGNGKSYKMQHDNTSLVPLRERFIEGYYATFNEGYINLDTMKKLLDKKKEVISGVANFNVTNGIFVTFDDFNETLRAYNTKGELIDEVKINLGSDAKLTEGDFIEMWDNNIQITYENGEFYQIENGKKSELDYTPVQAINLK